MDGKEHHNYTSTHDNLCFRSTMMSTGVIEVVLPRGNIGLQLEAAEKVKRGAIGCKIASSKNAENSFSNIVGSKLLTINGRRVDTALFEDIVLQLKSAENRVITCEVNHKIKDSTTPRINCENATPNTLNRFTTVSSVNKTPFTSLSVVKDSKTSPGSLMRDFLRSETAALKSSSVATLAATRESHVTFDESVVSFFSEVTQDSLLPAECAGAVSDTSSVLSPHQPLQHYQYQENDGRERDGMVALLRYQLDKAHQTIAEQKQVTASASVPNAALSTQLFSSWVLHITKFARVLPQIRRESTYTTSSAASSVSSEVNARLAERLEAQLRSWTEQQIVLHRQLAEQEVAARYQVPTTTITSAPVRHTKPPLTNHRTTTRAPALSTAAAVVKPQRLYTPAPVTSTITEISQDITPSACHSTTSVASPGGLLLKSQMERLRQESTRIRDDLQRFRSTIKDARNDVASRATRQRSDS